MTAVSALDIPSVDFGDPTLVGRRFHEVLARLARQHWLARVDIGFLVLERQAAIDVLRDRRLAFPAEELLLLQGIHDGPVYERTVRGLMVKSGEPHLRMRRLVATALPPRSIKRLRGQLRDLLEDLWVSTAGDGRCDFVTSFAHRIPSALIAELLGVPGEAEQLARWSILLQAVFKPNLAADREAVERAYEEVRAWVLELLSDRRSRPGDDFISALATLEQDGDRLTDEECVTLVAAVISGGTDTTQAQLAHGMRVFAEHPDQWELLARRPELADLAANEVLRFEPITPFTARIAREDFEHRGVRFPPWTILLACAATANRDPGAFARPDVFDISIDRGRTPVLTFGFGDHFCLGAQLARMELAETFSFLAPRMRHLQLDGEPVFGSIKGIYAMTSVPLRFDASGDAVLSVVRSG